MVNSEEMFHDAYHSIAELITPLLVAHGGERFISIKLEMKQHERFRAVVEVEGFTKECEEILRKRLKDSVGDCIECGKCESRMTVIKHVEKDIAKIIITVTKGECDESSN